MDKMKDFYRQWEGSGNKEVIWQKKKKKHVGYCQVIFLLGEAGVYQADDLTSAFQVVLD